MSYPSIKLKQGRDESVRFGHPWIFSGALEKPSTDIAHGDLVSILSPSDERLGVGTYSAMGSISIRVFDRRDLPLDRGWFAKLLREADARRGLMGYGPGQSTTGYRVLFGEADGAPGLVVDRYNQSIVFTLSTAGLDRLRPEIIAAIDEVFAPSAIVERSDVSSRKDEGLSTTEVATHKGVAGEPVEFMESGVKFLADILHGQKTGFFLDQKELRRAIGKAARGRNTLNLFSYTGASALAAMLGGASSAHNVDSSARALEVAEMNARLLKISPERFTVEKADIFKWLDPRRNPEYGLVVMDPPSIIKSRKDQKAGKKAYHFLNRAAMRLVKDGGLFVTSSCSQFLSMEDFTLILRRAAAQAEVRLCTVGCFGQAPDHPVSAHFPESGYLKSFIFEVRR
ncbi:MAG: class I SAM-dependent rRNA methyltransferase [Nitrospinota bacterium]|nr:class I SAM-dependent rRNA methyltransferase [Nitrospinota bacterium]